MVDASSSEDSQQSSTDLSRRRVVAGAVTLSVAGALSPAFAQPTDRSPDMPVLAASATAQFCRPIGLGSTVNER